MGSRYCELKLFVSSCESVCYILKHLGVIFHTPYTFAFSALSCLISFFSSFSRCSASSCCRRCSNLRFVLARLVLGAYVLIPRLCAALSPQ